MSRRLALLPIVLGLVAMATPGWAKSTICPGPVTVPGIDVSSWQIDINWPKVAASGKRYASIRVAHALKLDKKFDYNWKQCHAVGMHCGVYQYFEPNIDPIEQAKLVLQKMGPLQPGDLPPMIDVESTGGGVAPAGIAAAVGKWIAHVEAATGVKPIIYTGGYFWESNVQSKAFAKYPLWHAQYTSATCPSTVPSPWTKWFFWQYSSTGSVPGVTTNCDMNRFNGDEAALDTFCSGGTATCKAACSGTTLTQADCTQVDCAKVQQDGACVADALGPRCVSKLCPAVGSGAVCLPSPAGKSLIGNCKDGALSVGDCAPFAAWCATTVPPQAKCVSAFCVASATDKPVVKDICGPDGKRYHCDTKGDVTPKDCPADTLCKSQSEGAVCQPKGCQPGCDGTAMVGADCQKTDCAATNPDGLCALGPDGQPKCVDKACPPQGTATICLPDPAHLAIGLCQDGILTKATCMAGEQVCALIPGGALCAAVPCVPDPPNMPPPRQVCSPSGALLACNAQGEAVAVSCPSGSSCIPSSDPATCVPDASQDAGSGDADGGDEDGADAAGGSDDASPTGSDDDAAYAAEDGGAMGAGDVAPAVGVGAAAAAPVDSGCSARGGSPAPLSVFVAALLLVCGTMLCRRRS